MTDTSYTTVKAKFDGKEFWADLRATQVDRWLRAVDKEIAERGDFDDAVTGARDTIVEIMRRPNPPPDKRAQILAATLLWLACRAGGIPDAELAAREGDHTLAFDIGRDAAGKNWIFRLIMYPTGKEARVVPDSSGSWTKH